MVVYLCTIWDENDKVVENIVCANLEEVKKAYTTYLLSCDSKEFWEKYTGRPFEELVDDWYERGDDCFQIKKLKVRGL